MRGALLTVAMVAFAGPSLAGSIQMVTTGKTSGDSVTVINCAQCAAAKPASMPGQAGMPGPMGQAGLPGQPEHHGATAAMLPPGTQKIEVSEVGGVRKVRRTEAWMGGSPVTFISTSPVWAPAQEGRELAVAPDIDRQATTAAVAVDKPDAHLEDKNTVQPAAPGDAEHPLRLSQKGA